MRFQLAFFLGSLALVATVCAQTTPTDPTTPPTDPTTPPATPTTPPATPTTPSLPTSPTTPPASTDPTASTAAPSTATTTAAPSGGGSKKTKCVRHFDRKIRRSGRKTKVHRNRSRGRRSSRN
ncbi:uncharacterized protein Dana_GF25246 [Drosophila ananassae]|uniref:Uncharacterized protein n=1 Tax=Drosophila ananassae TaxID=7217 RepID=B3M3X1_DROAN|nr:levansucrase [Drosophila ananassae]EDV39305.1 uncharacterized protein Dana_GF24567 [Drosophila ananassae]EDV39307.1 uncharacterized protein Dana_GF25246 [Drosophila ananassae]